MFEELYVPAALKATFLVANIQNGKKIILEMFGGKGYSCEMTSRKKYMHDSLTLVLIISFFTIVSPFLKSVLVQEFQIQSFSV